MKKLLILSTVLIMTISFAGCTDSKKTTSSKDTTTTTSSVASNKTETTSSQTSSVEASSEPAPQPVTVNPEKITLSHVSVTLTQGNSKTVTATVKPDNVTDKTVTWSSSDTNIATVNDKGQIYCKNPGTCTVTVTATSDTSVKREIKVTVKAKEVVTPPTSSTPSGGGTTIGSGSGNGTIVENPTSPKPACPICGSNDCKSYTWDRIDGQWLHIQTLCPQFVMPEPPTHCPVCGLPKGDGTNGTCNKSHLAG